MQRKVGAIPTQWLLAPRKQHEQPNRIYMGEVEPWAWSTHSTRRGGRRNNRGAADDGGRVRPTNAGGGATDPVALPLRWRNERSLQRRHSICNFTYRRAVQSRKISEFLVICVWLVGFCMVDVSLSRICILGWNHLPVYTKWRYACRSVEEGAFGSCSKESCCEVPTWYDDMVLYVWFFSKLPPTMQTCDQLAKKCWRKPAGFR